ncbi:hypothetical protein [Lactobacillus ultunensis]|uniref:Uncharacterized protein n=1 Tax=Lactobacillus ultunensis DSM 16047 TaxID=525365 RepID=C2ENB2_9LACO|nr:hypothetical protein [Lactobacillus ultunensis]EEJ71916.1 hypothetical protein HMPREF0548_1158 [Lactobacillus ultunensis DSM 16047]KRL82086.1 integral membrane protein [Lactobacillus ultunensis DSM 16047]QQP27669.1 hypothetical protein H4B44_05915 [Lactobacillus ultunensis]
MSYLFKTVTHSLLQELILLGIPTIVVLLLTFINRNTKRNLASTLGVNSQIYLGWLGIIVHELSHLLIAILAGHHIEHFKLICSPREVDINGGRLGYVDESYNPKSLYQRVGTCFIGTAPIWGCTLAVYLILVLMEPNMLRQLQFFSSQIMQGNTKIAFLSLLTTSYFQYPISLERIMSWIGIFLLISLVVGGFDLSSADLHNSWTGFALLYIIMAVLIIILNLLGLGIYVNKILKGFIFIFVSIMSISVILSIIVNLISKVLRIL